MISELSRESVPFLVKPAEVPEEFEKKSSYWRVSSGGRTAIGLGIAKMATKSEKEAGLVMGTNGSSIVSKRSVERAYFSEPHFFRYFVKKPQRRSPLINRGYWLRMRAIERSVRQFLARPSDRPKLVINLGCGFDPLPFQFLQHEPELCNKAKFMDIDYQKLMFDKRYLIQQRCELSELIPDANFSPEHNDTLIRDSHYVGIGCDLAGIQGLETALRSEIDVTRFSVLCVAEVSLTYMTVEAADSVVKWASGLSDYVQFCLLEQYFPDGPEHPFAKTMMKHFSKLRTPLNSIHSYPSLLHQERRFVDCGWKHAQARSLWDLWNDSEFLDDAQATSLDSVEAFDEWEEFALFAAHYFILYAHTYPPERETVPSQSTFPSGLNGISKTTPTSLSLLSQCPTRFNGQRRFGATVRIGDEIVGLHGGLGRQTRLSSSDAYSRTTIEEPVHGLPTTTVAPRMCHTITGLKGTDALLVGGRTSPTTALGDCWLRRGTEWREVDSLPLPRYRHCATAIDLAGEECVLVYGGKSKTSDVFGDFFLWREPRGWQHVKVAGNTPPARFGACLACVGENSGVLFGGMDGRGRVRHDFWTWTLTEPEGVVPTITLEDRTQHLRQTTPLFRWLGRFGASVNLTRHHVVVIGGIATEGFVCQENEVLLLPLHVLRELCNGTQKLSASAVVAPTLKATEPRPLLVGHSSCTVGGHGKVLIVGGGAVCFSFGTHWNEGTWLLQEETCDSGNEWLPVEASADTEQGPSLEMTETDEKSTGCPTPPTTVPRVRISSSQEFEAIVDAARPVILEGLDIGPCCSLWTDEHLKDAVGYDRKIVVHDSRSDHMNFQTKNFSYTTKEFGRFINEVCAGSRQYLRAISSMQPTEVPANLSVDFPGLNADFRLPPELRLVAENTHSSPLRISGPVTLWLHYDVLANVLCQVRGEKNLILYPPWDVSRLGFPAGSSSSCVNIFRGTPDRSPVSPPGTNPHQASLKRGDVLFIPPLWPHAASPTGAVSVAVNVFFRNLPLNCYAPGRDVYGNRDLQAYEKGRRDVEKIARTFDRLPHDVAQFYLNRLADELKEKAKR